MLVRQQDRRVPEDGLRAMVVAALLSLLVLAGGLGGLKAWQDHSQASTAGGPGGEPSCLRAGSVEQWNAPAEWRTAMAACVTPAAD